MALIKCRVCGAINKKEAKFCENCGIKISKNKRKILPIIVLVLIIIGAIILRVYLVNEKRNDNNQEKENNHIEESMKDTLSKEFSYISTLTCSALNNITGINAEYIFADNEIYEYNQTKLYSNNENCKFYQSLDSTIMTYMDRQIQTKESDCVRYTQEGGFRKYGYSYYQKYFKTLGDNVMYTNTFTNNGNAIISIDNQIKLYKIDNDTISYQDIEYHFDEDEYVIYVSDVIKTNKAFYKVKGYKTNKEECDKYVDVACVYGYKLEKVEDLTKYYDDIKIAMNGYAVDKENNLYYY